VASIESTSVLAVASAAMPAPAVKDNAKAKTFDLNIDNSR
jgi:hypothetical protein